MRGLDGARTEARGGRAEPAPGILSHLHPLTYAGRVNCITGYGAAARHQIHVLRSHGLRLRIVDTGSAGDPDPKRESAFVQACRASSPNAGGPRGSIIHMGPNCTGPWRRKLPRPHVLVSVWETTRLPREWVPLISSFDQVWTATQWQADVYVDSGVPAAKVRFVPFALDPALYPEEGPRLPEVEKLRAEGLTVFGSMFQWTERKAPRALIGSFLQAFQEGERVALALKAYEGDDAATPVKHHVDQIIRSYHLPGPAPRVEVLTRRLSHDETLAFYRSLDCYVSAHRAEGFGLGICEALLLGRPVIATDWSAPAEWAAGCYMPVACTLEAPHSMEWQPFYSLDQLWAAPSQSDLAALMREVYDGRAVYRREMVQTQIGGLVQRAGEAALAALTDLLGSRR